jgi:hypothetical protein
MTPVEAMKEKNGDGAYGNMYGYKIYFKRPEPKFKVGDYVRITRTKGTFEQGYIPHWSRQVYIITKVQQTWPITYSLKEEDNTPIEGAFYTQELQLTEKPEYYKYNSKNSSIIFYSCTTIVRNYLQA